MILKHLKTYYSQGQHLGIDKSALHAVDSLNLMVIYISGITRKSN
jgi:hypothetical protein